MSRDTSRIVTANIGSDSLALFERGSNPAAWSQTVISVGNGPEGIDLSPDEKEVWTAHSRDGGVSIVDVAAKKVAQTLGKWVLVSDLDGGELVVVDAAARKEIKRIPVGKNPEGILVAPDGSRAYVAVNGDNYVAIIDLTTLGEAGRISTGAGPDGMAWAARK